MAKIQADDEIVSPEEDFKSFGMQQSVIHDLEAIGETPHRCPVCGKLLFRGAIGENGVVNIKCRCGTMNTFKVHDKNDPMVNFQDKIYHNRTRRLKH